MISKGPVGFCGFESLGLFTVGALIIRKGFWGTLSYSSCTEEP